MMADLQTKIREKTEPDQVEPGDNLDYEFEILDAIEEGRYPSRLDILAYNKLTQMSPEVGGDLASQRNSNLSLRDISSKRGELEEKITTSFEKMLGGFYKEAPQVLSMIEEPLKSELQNIYDQSLIERKADLDAHKKLKQHLEARHGVGATLEAKSLKLKGESQSQEPDIVESLKPKVESPTETGDQNSESRIQNSVNQQANIVENEKFKVESQPQGSNSDQSNIQNPELETPNQVAPAPVDRESGWKDISGKGNPTAADIAKMYPTEESKQN